VCVCVCVLVPCTYPLRWSSPGAPAVPLCRCPEGWSARPGHEPKLGGLGQSCQAGCMCSLHIRAGWAGLGGPVCVPLLALCGVTGEAEVKGLCCFAPKGSPFAVGPFGHSQCVQRTQGQLPTPWQASFCVPTLNLFCADTEPFLCRH